MRFEHKVAPMIERKFKTQRLYQDMPIRHRLLLRPDDGAAKIRFLLRQRDFLKIQQAFTACAMSGEKIGTRPIGIMRRLL